MHTINYNGNTYEVDSKGFLLDFDVWDEDFAKGMAIGARIIHSLTKEHWDVIYFIRNKFKETGKCPLFYETCMMNGLQLNEMKRLFPSGYLRGACKLAGITYKEGFLDKAYLSSATDEYNNIAAEKTYVVDMRGFLVNPDNWDELYASYKAYEMKIPEGKLTEKHWQIIHFLRQSFQKNGEVPTVYETCEANQIDLDELERLFPDGYHRGAVKIAGLRVI